MPTFILPSFAKGEISPSLYGRVDTAMYQVALRTARNVIVHASGGVSNRSGTLIVGPVKDHTVSTTRLFDFQFRTTDQYVLEFGNLYMRVIRNDAHVLNTAVNITGATQANSVVVTAASHGFSNGDEVFITGVVGMTQLNGNRYIVQSVTSSTFRLTHQVTGDFIDGTGFTAYTSGGTVATIFELVTPYVSADLATLKMVQSGDIMTITHPTYAPRDLARTDHNAWTLTVNTYAPGQEDLTNVVVVAQGTTGSTTHRYQMTAIRQEEDIFEESLPGTSGTARTITGATQANPAVITSTSHAYANGDEVEIAGIVGMTELNNRRFFIANQTANTFELEGEDSTSHTAYVSGGTARATFREITNSIAIASTNLTDFNRITWNVIAGANRYAIYRRESGRYRLIGEVDAPLTTFDDVTTAVTAAGAIHAVDNDIGPPRARNPFLLSGDFPATSGYFEQRQVYGGTNNNSDTKYYSQTGNRLNMSVSTPVQADDAITATLFSNEVSTIRHFVPGGDLLVLTDSSEWRVNSGENAGFSADTLRQKPQSQWGASHQRPIVVGNIVLFVEEGNARVRSLGYSLELDGYTGSDLTLLADHLLTEDGPNRFIIDDWSYASVPESRLYIVRSDGRLLTMTFNQSQEVIAWTVWDTDGNYEATTALRRSVSSVEDGVYFVVQRTTAGGATTRYIERLSTRKFSDVRDAFFLDGGFTLDSPTVITAVDSSGLITAVGHGRSTGDFIDIEGIEWAKTFDTLGNETNPSNMNDQRFRIRVIDSSTFRLDHETINQGHSIVDAVRQTSPYADASLATDGDMDMDVHQGCHISPDGLHLFKAGNVDGTGENRITRYTLVGPGELRTATYDGDTQILDTQGNVSGLMADVFLKDDGLELYIIGNHSGNQVVGQWTLTTAWDLTTATHTRNFTINAGTDGIRAFTFRLDGLRMFLAMIDSDTIISYTLTTAWDISTAIQDAGIALETISEDNNMFGIAFATNGLRMFLAGTSNERVYEYDLAVAFDVSSAIYNGINLDLSGVFTNPTSLSFCENARGEDDTRLIILDADDGIIYEYTVERAQAAERTPPTYLSGGNVRQAVLTITGLEDLEGMEFGIGKLGLVTDGSVSTPADVSGAPGGNGVLNASITLLERASRVHIGRLYISDIETLDPTVGEGTVQGKIKRIPRVVIRFKKSRLGLIGPNSSQLTKMKQRENEPLGGPTALLTGDKKQILPPKWNSNGRLFYRQIDPLPVTILAIIPDMGTEDAQERGG